MIIGVVGFMGSGKGTVGDILKEFGFKQESFAKPVKDAAAVIFGWDREMLEGATEASRAWREEVDVFWSEKLGWRVTPRAVLQKIGTEGGRNLFGSPIWTAALQKRIEESHHKDFVITDVRFENEIKALRDMGGYIVRVKRGAEPEWFNDAIEAKKLGATSIAADIHISEWDWVTSKMDYTIKNDGTLQQLRNHTGLVIDLINLRNIPL